MILLYGSQMAIALCYKSNAKIKFAKEPLLENENIKIAEK